MKFDETAYERIDAFLRGALPESEAEAVRRQMAEDPDFAAEVEWMKHFLGMMRDERRRKVLDDFEAIHQSKRRDAVRRKRLWLAAALLVAILLILLALLLSGREPNGSSRIERETTLPDLLQDPDIRVDPEATPDTARTPVAPIPPDPGPAPASPPPATPPARPDTAAPIAWESFVEYQEGLSLLGEESSDSLDQALLLVSQGRRLEALPYFEAYLQSLPPEEDDLVMRLETGKIYLKDAKKYERAAFHFERVLQTDGLPVYRAEARYYLALSDIARGEIEAAVATLRQIAADGPDRWKTQAAEVLQALE